MQLALTYFLIVSLGVLLSACGGGSDDPSSELLNSDGLDAISSEMPNGDGSGETGAQKIALSWTAPSTRTNGDFLVITDLAGYRIYYGTSRDELELLVDIADFSETERTITVPSPGIYYFAVTAYDLNELESSFSQIVSKDAS